MPEPQDPEGVAIALGCLFYLLPPLLLLTIGYVAGSMSEKGHLKRLARKERELSYVTITDLRHYQPGAVAERHAEMVIGEVVIATDYWKTLLAKIKKLFGGELGSYLSLMERARREAIVRVLQEAREKGHNAVCNVRLITADIGGTTANAKGAAMVAIMAWATAYTLPTKDDAA